MAVDKLVDSTQLDADLTSVANAIRTKGGTSSQLAFPAGFVSAVQAIPTGGVTPTGTKQISITQNGVTTEDVTNYANAEITANVPNSYAAADEGKVVSSGALVAQGSDTVTQNDTYDTTLISSLTVNVSGGGGYDTDGDALIAGTISGRLETKASTIHAYGIYSQASLTEVYAPNASGMATYGCASNSNMETLVLPSCRFLNANSCRDNAKLTAVDFKGNGNTSNTQIIGNNVFLSDAKLTMVVIRATSITGIMLYSAGAFNNTPFASGGTGGTLYVPSSLVSTYQSASNWSTVLARENNQIKSIESTHTDPDAPIDLTLYYADGTPIPTT